MLMMLWLLSACPYCTFATMLSNRKASCLMDSPFFTPFLQTIFKQDGFLITEVAAFHNTSPAPNDKHHTHADFVFVCLTKNVLRIDMCDRECMLQVMYQWSVGCWRSKFAGAHHNKVWQTQCSTVCVMRESEWENFACDNTKANFYIIVRQRIRGSTRFRSPRAVAI